MQNDLLIWLASRMNDIVQAGWDEHGLWWIESHAPRVLAAELQRIGVREHEMLARLYWNALAKEAKTSDFVQALQRGEFVAGEVLRHWPTPEGPVLSEIWLH